MRRRAERLCGGPVHLSLDDLGVDAVAAVVHRCVVDDFVDPGLRIDLDRASVDLRRVGKGEVAELALEIGLLELGPVDVPNVQRDVQVRRQSGVVRVQDRAEGHERQRGLWVPFDPRLALDELDVVRRTAEDGSRELFHLACELVGGALHRAQTGDGELRRVRPREPGGRVPVGVVAGADVHVVGRATEDLGDDLR